MMMFEKILLKENQDILALYYNRHVESYLVEIDILNCIFHFC